MATTTDTSKTGIVSGGADLTVDAVWTFATMPEAHVLGGEGPIYGRTSTDGKTIAAWNLLHDGVEGDLFHLTTGPNTTANANGAVIAIGVDYGGLGLITRNKSVGTALRVDQLSTVSSATGYAVVMYHESTVAPFSLWSMAAAATQPMIKMAPTTAGNIASGAVYMEVVDPDATTPVAGRILADTGVIDWRRTIQTVAPRAGITPQIRVADEVATTPTESYIQAKTTGETGLVLKRNSTGGAGASRFLGKFVNDAANGDRFVLRVSRGAVADGSEVYADLITLRANAGTGNKGQMAFFGASPTNQPAAISSPTADAASLKTAVDAIRTALTNLGLTA